MATLNSVIVPAKALKGGRHKIRIAVAHNGETRYIVTDIIIDSAKEFKNGAIVRRPDAAMLNTKLRGILQRYQNTIDELGYVSALTCAELVYQLKNAGQSKHRTLESIFEEFIESNRAKESTKEDYRQDWGVIKKCLSDNMFVENVTYSTVVKIDNFLRKRNISQCTLRGYMVFLKMLINFAKKHGYAQYRVDPFVGYRIPEPTIRKAWLTVDEIKRIRDIDDKSVRKNIRKCRDIFMLSYYLGGVNIVDLKKINFGKQKENVLYIRTKTENRSKANDHVEFRIPDEAKEIIARHLGRDGCLALTDAQKRDDCHAFFRVNMPKLAEAAGLKKLIYYSARKSFAQHAFNLGVSESVIDYILGHKVDKGGTSLFNYLFVTPEMATEAVRKVLDNLK